MFFSGGIFRFIFGFVVFLLRIFQQIAGLAVQRPADRVQREKRTARARLFFRMERLASDIPTLSESSGQPDFSFRHHDVEVNENCHPGLSLFPGGEPRNET